MHLHYNQDHVHVQAVPEFCGSPVYCTTHLYARSRDDPFENEVLDDCRG